MYPCYCSDPGAAVPLVPTETVSLWESCEELPLTDDDDLKKPKQI